MKVLVNSTALLAPLTGIGHYIRNLFGAMTTLQTAQIQYFEGTGIRTKMSAPHAANRNDQPSDKKANTLRPAIALYGWAKRWVPRSRSLKRMAEKASFAWHTQGLDSDVLYHEPNHLPLPYNGPSVLTICDLSCFDHPASHPMDRVRIMEKELPKAIERADHLIVISKATQASLQQWFSVPDHKITNTYLAADARFKPRSKEVLAPALAPLGLAPEGYVLCVGTLEPRKNLITLFDAYARLSAPLRARYPLVLAGMKGWHTDALMSSARALLARQELRILGYVSDEMVANLYSGAAAVCYPSRYEGFGLPALEAMASGVPIICSNATSLPEVVGPDGLMFDPDDVLGFTDGLRHVLEDRQFAGALGMRGLMRAQTFSWEKCATETVSVYSRVLRQRGIDF
jgi:alpha-1,3-rhamnosyl/mannosyltransferase